MGRYTDYAPVGNTCPMIDKVISSINGFDFTEEDYSVYNKDRIEAIDLMEKIRSANEELRLWGNDEYQNVKSLTEERDELERINSDLQDEISELKSVIAELEQNLREAYERL